MALTLILGTGVVGAKVVNADSTTDTKSNFMSGFVTAISQKFSLSETEVQAVFTEQAEKQHAEMEAKFTANFAEKLSTAVTEGKLTQTQSDLITAKQAEIKTQREALKNSDVKPTKEEMQAQMEDLKTWAEANNIPNEYLMLGGHRGKGGHGPFGKGALDTKTTTQ